MVRQLLDGCCQECPDCGATLELHWLQEHRGEYVCRRCKRAWERYWRPRKYQWAWRRLKDVTHWD